MDITKRSVRYGLTKSVNNYSAEGTVTITADGLVQDMRVSFNIGGNLYTSLYHEPCERGKGTMSIGSPIDAFDQIRSELLTMVDELHSYEDHAG